MSDKAPDNTPHQGPVAILMRVETTYLMLSVSVPVIQGVDILVRPACFAALLGPSGNGKTTLLNLFGCIDRPDAGEVMLAGCMPVLRAHEKIQYPLLLTGAIEKNRADRVPKLLEAVGLADIAADGTIFLKVNLTQNTRRKGVVTAA